MTTVDNGLDPAPSAFEGERLMAPQPKPAGRRTRRIRGGFTPYSLLTPAIIVLALITGWPLVQLIITSFQEFGRAQVFGAAPEWVWFENYANVLTDPVFWAVLVRTLVFSAACVVITMFVGTLIALLMMRLPKGFRILLSVGMLLAWAMPALTATVVWGWMFDTALRRRQLRPRQLVRHGGVLPALLAHRPAELLLRRRHHHLWSRCRSSRSRSTPGLTQVPDEVLEAAQLDGASGFKRFRLIIFPYLKPIFLIVTILQIIWDLRVFTQIFALQDIGGIRALTPTRSACTSTRPRSRAATSARAARSP